MKKFNAFNVYTLGKELFPAMQFNRTDSYPFKEVFIKLWRARAAVQQQLGEESVFLDASKRAAQEVVRSIDAIVPVNLSEAIDKKGDDLVYSWTVESVKEAIQTLETVLGNDMPGLSAYLVAKKGIYSTEDLIQRADNHFLEDMRKDIPDRAKEDFREAGKCLAYEVPTACAFHLWRSVETVAEAYYLKITGNTFEAAKLQRNWFSYIKALEAVGADTKITEFLDHIRAKYRNPQMHPNEMVSVAQAFGLFGAAASAINQLVLATQQVVGPQLPLQQVVPAGTGQAIP